MTVGEQMKHYGYVQSKVDKFVGKTTPEDLEDAAGEIITKVDLKLPSAVNLALLKSGFRLK